MPFFASFVIFVVQAFLFFNRPFASLTQARKERKERRKDMFIGPPGQPNPLFFASFALFAVQSFLRVLRDLRGSSFSFLNARSLRSLKHAKTAKKDRQECLFGPPGQPKMFFSLKFLKK
jgi:hypothetical protein